MISFYSLTQYPNKKIDLLFYLIFESKLKPKNNLKTPTELNNGNN
jgi:hypothetical protein